MNEAEVRAWVLGHIRNTAKDVLAGWEDRLACEIPGRSVGDVGVGILGSMYCSECSDQGHGCMTIAYSERWERWLDWCVKRRMADLKATAESQRIQALRELDGAEAYGVRRLG